MSNQESNDPSVEVDPPVKKPGFFALLWNAKSNWRFARRLLIGLAVFITLIAVLLTLDGIRGKWAWENFQAELKAAGEPIHSSELPPPPVPDDQNFAMTPLLAPLLDYEYNTYEDAKVWRDPAAKERLITLTDVVFLHVRIPLANRHKLLITDLAPWQVHIRGITNFALPPDRISAANIEIEASNPGKEIVTYDTNYAAKDILIALEFYDQEMNELHQAARRPHAQFPIHYHEGFAAVLPHLRVLRNFSRVSQLKAVALLADDQAEQALAEVLLMIQMSKSIRGDALLISGLVQVAILRQFSLVVWEGIARRQWTPEHLKTLEQGLRSVNLVIDYRHAIRGERVLATETVLKYHSNLHLLSDGNEGWLPDLLRWGPRGLFYQNLVYLGRAYDPHLALPVVDVEKRRFDLILDNIRATQIDEDLEHIRPYNLLARMLIPAFSKALRRYAEGQVEVDQMRLACAIELFRHQHGHPPESLAELAPNFIPTVPSDPLTGQPYLYTHTGNDYTLYSLGANGTDEGGLIVWKEGNRPDQPDSNQGDWVWRSLPAGN